MKDVVTTIFGDSIVYGIGDSGFNGWVNRLNKKLSKENYLFNLGIPGQNSNDILNRFEIEFKNRYNLEDEFNIIFSFGIKDALIINEDKKHIETFKNNINELIKISKKYSNNIYFIGLIFPDVNLRTNYNLDNVLLIDNILRDICKENEIKYIELKNEINNSDLFDGLHPNSFGHKKISEKVLKKVFKIH